MKSKLIKITIGLLSIIVLFHFSVVAKVIPFDIAWGGRLENDLQMYVFEAFSILVLLILILILLMKGGHIKKALKERYVNNILIVYIVLFAINTVGNFFAKTLIEKSFAALTLLLAIVLYLIVRMEKSRVIDIK